MSEPALGVTTPGRAAGADTAAFDVERIREDFPILRRQIRGRPLTYLDNAATTQKPQAVLDALMQYYTTSNANVHRGVHLLSEIATEAHEVARGKARAFFNARAAREIVFTRNSTEGINLVAHAFGRWRVAAGDEVVISAMEHHSNIVPWQLLCEERGAHLRVAPINDDGELILDALDELLGSRTRLLSVTHMSNALGTINPIATIVRMAHAKGVPVLVDGSQAAYHMPVDVQALECDFYVATGHKLYGPTGIGVLYGREALLEEMPPFLGGGDMIRSVTFEKSTWNDLPYKFEAGTPDIAGAIGLGAALDYITGAGLANISAHEADLLAYATSALEEIPGARLIGTARKKASILSFVLEGVHPHDIGTIVDREGVAIRTGHHCAQPVMERFGVPATARASFAMYNTRRDVDALIGALRRVQSVFAWNRPIRPVTEGRMDLADLYQEVILDHNRRPRNFRRIEPSSHHAEGYNPLCGDRVTVFVRVEQDRIADLAFEGSGCAISKASASLMTDRLKGCTVEEARDLFGRFHRMVTTPPDEDVEDLGKLSALAGVREFPVRVKCASLAWHTLKAALDREERTSTE